MKYKFLLILITILFSASHIYSQEEEKQNKVPVRAPFESGVLIDGQTVVTPLANTFEFVIQHRFGNINNDKFDLLGIFGPSNIRLGLNYTILDRIQIGLGTSKNKLVQDLNWKWGILQQTRSNSIPVAVTYYGNVAIEAAESEAFAEMTHRISYFHQIMVARKFNSKITAQINFAYAHFNAVDSSTFVPENEEVAVQHDRKHDNFSAGIAGRVKITPQTAILLEFEYPLFTPKIDKPEPNVALGIEIGTSGHAFQVFLGSYRAIVPQYNMVYNTNDFTESELLIGFNITRLWNF